MSEKEGGGDGGSGDHIVIQRSRWRESSPSLIHVYLPSEMGEERA